ncbi:hypothetical protein B9Q04_16420 [Candidatus Marsarchaeota G2 archaeon BE_D]|jgi:hypothetical protein|uniref:Uncharacterized protein n=1 Tax=Candidatus Marsarchaeota G2 archaeon BE_D TaxID=1978158 RepID=A0A2R6C651_9ARCH|nr:MAG: hypothetical protein B9Q04_16420 [Candidatus Marsarchaeota G2 archaeon BE_D]
MDKVKLKGSIAYVYKVFVESLNKTGIETAGGALNENTVVVGVPLKSFVKMITMDVNKEVWELKIKNGKMFLIGTKELVDEDVKKVNTQILSKLKKLGVEADAHVTDDGDAVVMVSLVDVVLRILEKTLQETKARASNHMRSLRVKFGSDDDYAYVVLYTRSSQKDTVLTKIEEVLKNE